MSEQRVQPPLPKVSAAGVAKPPPDRPTQLARLRSELGFVRQQLANLQERRTTLERSIVDLERAAESERFLEKLSPDQRAALEAALRPPAGG